MGKRNAEFLDHASQFNDSVKLLSISIGDKDFLVNATKSLEEVLDKHGIKHESHTSGGGHTWNNWRPLPVRVRTQAVSVI